MMLHGDGGYASSGLAAAALVAFLVGAIALYVAQRR
jgi:hypothetical protein